MRFLHAQDLRVLYGSIEALKSVSIEVDTSEFVAILGPSGCGKTTLLRSIAGFVNYEGTIMIEGISYDNRPAHKRDFGLVFQDYALFPHKTVAANIAFGLRMRRRSRMEQEAKTGKLLRLLHLDKLADRYPSQLSGGQNQRVALARALAVDPKLLLLDEPLSALDKKLREEMQVELRQLQQHLDITTIFVTHDQEEALALADKVIIMKEGRVHQVGTPAGIYEQPADRFVATFIGKSNVFEGVNLGFERDSIVCRISDNATVRVAAQVRPAKSEPVYFSVRPEHLRLIRDRRLVDGANVVEGVIDHVVYLGAHQQIRLRLDDGQRIEVRIPSRERWQNGEQALACWSSEDAVVIRA